MAVSLTDLVSAPAGKLRGIRTGKGVNLYLGIPYAVPPVGDRRFLPAELHGGWEGVRECTAFSASPAQPGLDHSWDILWSAEFVVSVQDFAEDSLTLNIWAPEGGENLPVVLYFYGGGFVCGGSSCEIYDGQALAEKGVIYVTFNHREGNFGTFATEELAAMSPGGRAGNQLLSDGVCALRWIHENIASFGGDPNNVTIWGQSSGAIEVESLLVNPMAKDLFARAIVMGYEVWAEKLFRKPLNNAPLAEAFARCSGMLRESGMTLRELQSAGPDKVLALPQFDSLTIGGFGIDADYRTALASGWGGTKPVLLGTVPGDTMMIPFFHSPSELLWENVHRLFPEHGGELEALYQGGGITKEFRSDAMKSVMLGAAAARMAAGAGPTFLYHFTHALPGPYADRFGAFHSCEVPYFTRRFTDLRKDYWQEQDFRLGDFCSGLAARFIQSGQTGFAPTDGTTVFHIDAKRQEEEPFSQEKKEVWLKCIEELYAPGREDVEIRRS